MREKICCRVSFARNVASLRPSSFEFLTLVQLLSVLLLYMQGVYLQFLCFVCFERKSWWKGIFYHFDIIAVTSKYFEFLNISFNRSFSGLLLFIKVDFLFIKVDFLFIKVDFLFIKVDFCSLRLTFCSFWSTFLRNQTQSRELNTWDYLLLTCETFISYYLCKNLLSVGLTLKVLRLLKILKKQI